MKLKGENMKKLLTSIITLSLIICCFAFVGCKNDKDNEVKPATVEQTLKIWENFMTDMKALETKISNQDYVYPTRDAIRASKAVSNTDKSSIGIEYSNYVDFDLEYNLSGEPGHSYTIKEEYLELQETIYVVDLCMDLYGENNLKLNDSYRVNINRYGKYAYIRLNNDNSQINLRFCFSSLDGSDKAYYDFTINIENSTWTSCEFKQCYNDDEFFGYAYLEKSTNEARIFDRFYFSTIDDEMATCELIDIDEKVQKLIHVDDFSIDSMNVLQSKVYNHHISLNIEDIREDFDFENATLTELMIVIEGEI